MNTASLDIVYFVKDSLHNEELRYSLRSVDMNIPYKRVWIFGGCPKNITPDVRVRVIQEGQTKWDKVRTMFKMACENKEITENFILFNDDFFVMKPTDYLETMYRSSLRDYINVIESKNLGCPTSYTKLLRECDNKLNNIGATRYAYELHTPFIFNKKKLLKLLDKYPDQHCTRSLYGNVYKIGGKQSRDVKIFTIKTEIDYRNSRFLSTDDSIVNINNDIWRYITKALNKKSRFED